MKTIWGQNFVFSAQNFEIHVCNSNFWPIFKISVKFLVQIQQVSCFFKNKSKLKNENLKQFEDQKLPRSPALKIITYYLKKLNKLKIGSRLNTLEHTILLLDSQLFCAIEGFPDTILVKYVLF